MSVINKLMFLSFLCLASWQDVKTKQISIWVYMIFSGLAACSFLCQTGESGWQEMIRGAGIGTGLLGISYLTKGAIGEGDGCFFMVTGLLLGFWKTLALLCYGLLFCSAFCVLLSLWGYIKKVSVRKYKIPFLPFLFPVGIWLILL